MLIATGVLAVVAGRFLLAFGEVPDAAIDSFLAVAFAFIVVLAFFVGLTFSPWIWLVLPVLSTIAFPAAAYIVKRAGAPLAPVGDCLLPQPRGPSVIVSSGSVLSRTSSTDTSGAVSTSTSPRSVTSITARSVMIRCTTARPV